MNRFLYIVAVILVIAWAVGFFGFHPAGNIIHLLLVLAIIAVLLRVIRGREPL